MSTGRFLVAGIVMISGGLLAGGCDRDGHELLDPEGALESSSLINRPLVQADRFGLPAINTAFVSSSSDKNRFNLAAPEDDESDFASVLAATIMARFGLSEANASALAGAVLPDVQPLGDLSGALFNGRRLDDDVIDVVLGILFGPSGLSEAAPAPALASDNVDGNDVAFLNRFPYLAPPNLPGS